jgi:hypothetical protein
MKILVTIVTMVGIVAVMVQYHRSADQHNGKDISVRQHDVTDEKNQILRELDVLENAVQEQIAHAGEYSETTDLRRKESLNNVEKRLQVQKKKIKESIHTVRSSSEDTWEAVKENTDRKMINAKIELSRVTEKIRNEIDDSR